MTLALALGLSACTGQDQNGSAVHRLSTWVKGTNLGEDIGTLVADNARVPETVPNGTGAVHGACGTLLTDAEMANGELPAPDVQITSWLTEAYGLEGTAANQCYDAGSTNPTLLTKAERNMIKAQALLSESLTRIEAIVGKPVSTTTTTDNAPGSIFG
jgi:hypothetical protein